MATYYLTTTDNPYDPKDEFDMWFAFDTNKGYNSCELLDSVCKTSSNLSDSLITDDIKEAIDWIINWDATGMRTFVER
nr:MAG TPA: hypothetical protein [Caudoviricetes sp.]